MSPDSLAGPWFAHIQDEWELKLGQDGYILSSSIEEPKKKEKRLTRRKLITNL